MSVYRSYIAACKTMSEKVQVTDEAAKVMLVTILDTLDNVSRTYSISKTTLSVSDNKISR